MKFLFLFQLQDIESLSLPHNGFQDTLWVVQDGVVLRFLVAVLGQAGGLGCRYNTAPLLEL